MCLFRYAHYDYTSDFPDFYEKSGEDTAALLVFIYTAGALVSRCIYESSAPSVLQTVFYLCIGSKVWASVYHLGAAVLCLFH